MLKTLKIIDHLANYQLFKQKIDYRPIVNIIDSAGHPAPYRYEYHGLRWKLVKHGKTRGDVLRVLLR